jgi:biotin carboxyl carrier protein
MDHLRITVEGKVYDVLVEKFNDKESGIVPPVAPIIRSAAPAVAAKPIETPAPQVVAGDGDAASPLAGIVQAVEVQVGAVVREGDLVITLEAMKMYTPINACSNGSVTAIHVKVGDAVEEGQALYTIG